MRAHPQLACAAVLGLLSLALPSRADERIDEPIDAPIDEPTRAHDDPSFDQALRAVRKGEAMPLSQAITQLHKTTPGLLVATEYEYEFERWVYEFTIIDPQGYLRRVHLDARTGELVRVTDD